MRPHEATSKPIVNHAHLPLVKRAAAWAGSARVPGRKCSSDAPSPPPYSSPRRSPSAAAAWRRSSLRISRSTSSSVPGEAIDSTDDDIWNWDNGEPEPSLLDTPIGPPLAGPTDADEIGPPLAGPEPEPLPVRERRSAAVRGRSLRAAGRPGLAPSSSVRRSRSAAAGPTMSCGSADKESADGPRRRAGDQRALRKASAMNSRRTPPARRLYYKDDAFNDQTIDARAKLRYDLTSRTSIFTEADYSRFLEGFSDPDTPNGAAKRPAVDTHRRLARRRAALRPPQRARDGLRGAFDATRMCRSLAAARLRAQELDNTEFGVRLRTGYATSASLRPFAEAAVGARAFDNARDDSGFERSSVWGELRGGLVIDRGEKLSGEASLGYRHEDIEDDRLEDLNVLLANAADPLVAAAADGSEARPLHQRQSDDARRGPRRPCSIPAR